MKSVSRYWTQYSSVGGEPVVASRKSEKPRSENTCLMISIGVIWAKIRQSEVRVRSQSQGLQHELIEIEVFLGSGPARLSHHAVEIALWSSWS